jgi:hypothetical protein
MPARRTSSRSPSNVTRKNDAMDIISQAIRKSTPSRASTSKAIAATSRLKNTNAGASRRAPR